MPKARNGYKILLPNANYGIDNPNICASPTKFHPGGAIMCFAFKGKRVLVRRSIQCAYGLNPKSRRDSTSVCEGAPKVFR